MRDLSARATRSLVKRMAREVAGRYRGAGLFAFFFARGKLTGDPLFASLLARGAIPDATRLVDLGCGQALLHGWLAVAVAGFDASHWPSHWPSPPRIRRYRGVDRSAIELERARHALGAPHEAIAADLATIDADTIGPCDVVTLFDVLHYLDPAQQERLLGVVAACLAPAGTLVLRIGDAGERSAARRSFAIDSVVARLRGYPHRLHRRSLAEWMAVLDAAGFDAAVLDAGPDGTSGLANVLIRARHSDRTSEFARPLK